MECHWDTSLLGWTTVEVLKGLASMKFAGEENNLIYNCGEHMYISDLPPGESLRPDFVNSINDSDVLLVDTDGLGGNRNNAVVLNLLEPQ